MTKLRLLTSAASVPKVIDEFEPLADSSRVLRKVGHALMILAVLAATGAHWWVLQSVAWTTMLAENLQTSSWELAVTRTFDGKHPCCLCKQIANGKQSEKKADFQLEARQLEFSYTSPEFVFCPPANFHEVSATDETAAVLAHAPPVPPPKELLG